MRVFLINLDKNPERMERSKTKLDQLGVEFERVSAVYGAALAPEEKSAAVNRFRWWCAQGRKIRDGEIGCALSHYHIYRRMIDENIPVACILEDDNCYRETFKEVLADVERLVDVSRPQVVLLSSFAADPLRDKTYLAPAFGDQWTSSYVITRLAAVAILAANFPLHVPCDCWGRWVKRGRIELYHSVPTIAVQDGHSIPAHGIPLAHEFGTSDIEGGEVFRVSELTFVPKLVHKTKRAIGCCLDSIMRI